MRFAVQVLILALSAQPVVGEWEQWYQKGRQLAVEGKLMEARSLLAAALRNAEERALGSEYVAATLHELGLVSLEFGRNAEARRYLTRCLALRKQLDQFTGEDTADTAKTLSALALTHLNQGDRQKADHFLARAIRIFEMRVGRDHPDYAIALHNLGELRVTQDRLPEAAKYLEQSLSIFERMPAAKPLETLMTLANLALVASRMGRYPQADSCSAQAVHSAEQRYSDLPAVLARVLFIRAEVLKNMGRKRDGKAVERRAKEVWRAYAEATSTVHTVDASEFRQR